MTKVVGIIQKGQKRDLRGKKWSRKQTVKMVIFAILIFLFIHFYF